MALDTKGKLFEDQARFFYYIAGISVAVFAYTVKELEPIRLGLNSHTIEILGLTLLAVSILLCFSTLTTITMAEYTAHMAIELVRDQEERDVKLSETLKEVMKLDEAFHKPAAEFAEYNRQWREKQMDQAAKSQEEHKRFLKKLKKKRKWQWGTFLGSLFILTVARILEPYLAGLSAPSC